MFNSAYLAGLFYLPPFQPWRLWAAVVQQEVDTLAVVVGRLVEEADTAVEVADMTAEEAEL